MRSAAGHELVVIPSVARNLQVSSTKAFAVYLMASRSKTLYTGVTSDLEKRVYQHKHGLVEGFTKRYRIERLVYFEVHGDVRAAIAREKQIKAWTREKRVALIEGLNPAWQDLAENWARKWERVKNKIDRAEKGLRTADSSLRSE